MRALFSSPSSILCLIVALSIMGVGLSQTGQEFESAGKPDNI